MFLKKTLLTTTAIAILTTTAYAAELKKFFDVSVGPWTIIGHTRDANLNPACLTITTWRDGSKFLLIQDLADGELYIEFLNNQWNVRGPYGKDAGPLELTMVMYRGNTVVQSWGANFTLTNKNTILIRGIDFRKFLPGFVEMTKIVLIMPGTIPNAEISLNGSARAINLMTRCLQEADNAIDNKTLEEFNKPRGRVPGRDA